MLVAASTLLLRDAQALPLTPIACSCVGAGASVPTFVAVSPDGEHAYLGMDESVVTVERDATNGSLGDGLVVATALPNFDSRAGAFSPDGRHLYLVGNVPVGFQVIALARDLLVGTLSVAQTVVDGQGGVDGLAGVRDVVVSPDGRHVYAVASQDDSIVAFARNDVTGTLGFLEVERNGVNGVAGMVGARAVAISPDGRHLYVAAAGEGNNAVAVFARNAVTGLLDFVEFRSDGVAGFDGLEGAIDVVVTRDGSGVFVLGAAEDAIAVLSRDKASGSLAFVEVERNGVAGVSSFANPKALVLDPLRPRVYAASDSEGPTAASLQIFEHDPTTGALVRRFFLTGESFANLAVSPDGRHLYAPTEVDGPVAAYAIAPLRFSTRVREGEGGIYGLQLPGGLAAFGASLYAISAFPSSVAAFARSGDELDFTSALFDGADGVEGIMLARGIAASPDGRHVYVTGDQDDAVATFARNGATGALTFAGAIYDSDSGNDGLQGAQEIAVSGDGAHVYVAAFADASVAHYARNAQTGALTFVAVHRDGEGGVDGLDGARAIALSPDGKNVYATGTAEDAVGVFSRHATTGALTFVEFEKDGLGGVSSMQDPYALAVSPDGRHVYVAARDSHAVVRFDRASSNGSLDWVGTLQDPVHLELTNDVAISLDGRLVFAIGGEANTLVTYWRDPETGSLGLAQTETDDEGLVSGLGAPAALLAQGRHLYVTSQTDEAIAVFVPEPGAGAAIAAALLALAGFAHRRGARGN